MGALREPVFRVVHVVCKAALAFIGEALVYTLLVVAQAFVMA